MRFEFVGRWVGARISEVGIFPGESGAGVYECASFPVERATEHFAVCRFPGFGCGLLIPDC